MSESYSKPEDKARHELINPALKKAGWKVQHFKTANIHGSKGVAVEFFQMGAGRSNYRLMSTCPIFLQYFCTGNCLFWGRLG